MENTGRETCGYYGTKGSNLGSGYCQSPATWDLGRWVDGASMAKPYELRYSCDEHEGTMIPWRYRKHGHDDEHYFGDR